MALRGTTRGTEEKDIQNHRQCILVCLSLGWCKEWPSAVTRLTSYFTLLSCVISKTSVLLTINKLGLCVCIGCLSCLLHLNNIGLNIFYSEEKDWARHTTRQCPLTCQLRQHKRPVKKEILTLTDDVCTCVLLSGLWPQLLLYCHVHGRSYQPPC